MAALTGDRDTRSRESFYRELPVKGATTIYAGAMVAMDTSGRAVPASATATLVVLGRADGRYNNAAGADGDLRARIRNGCYRFDNSSSTDAITAANIGSACYAVDDHTVALTNGSNARPKAGTIFDVDSIGVWVVFA